MTLSISMENILQLAERWNAFTQLVNRTQYKSNIRVSLDLLENFVKITITLINTIHLRGNGNIAMTEANFEAAKISVVAAGDFYQQFTSTIKTYVPVALRSELFTTSQSRMSIWTNEFLARYLAFKKIGLVFWTAPKPFITTTDKKFSARIFEATRNPQTLENDCEHVLHFNCTIAHIPEKWSWELLPCSEKIWISGKKIMQSQKHVFATKKSIIEQTGIIYTTTYFFWQRRQAIVFWEIAIPQRKSNIRINVHKELGW